MMSLMSQLQAANGAMHKPTNPFEDRKNSTKKKWEHVFDDGPKTTAQIAKLIGYSDNGVHRRIQVMKDRGYIKEVGKIPTGRTFIKLWDKV